ncbi:branched-chain amino acid ABC transporter permease [Allopusillimonas ginsengisoli]|uniref:branched-chain amino acid ABC transporter permease n=1 Tax=Allopusillimonas ginsengisoli TaxID=453575 RepID=UPI001020769B|nr:branched-chain amino acid ABC transporter permease [Allopusillimonas ginsengisoli]TEA79006.1 branched-chain amino acid ABC transporter permease [Allopusillimonas ginsengisoli]
MFNAMFVAVGALLFGALHLAGSEYLWFASYTVLQYVVLAVAWNILGGYAGYVNFGTAGLFGAGCYVAVLLLKLGVGNLAILIGCAAIVSGVLGMLIGYLTLRVKGAYFSIATLALVVLLETLITNWDYIGGARGALVVRPDLTTGFLSSYTEYLFMAMLLMAIAAVWLGRFIEESRAGAGLKALKDDELAAEAAGIPTLKLKLWAAVVSGALMGAAGAPAAYFLTFVEPSSLFGLTMSANTMAMVLIGGIGTWVGPVLGAIFVAVIQQIAVVTISSSFHLLLVAILMIVFLVAAPNGLAGIRKQLRKARHD